MAEVVVAVALFDCELEFITADAPLPPPPQPVSVNSRAADAERKKLFVIETSIIKNWFNRFADYTYFKKLASGRIKPAFPLPSSPSTLSSAAQSLPLSFPSTC
jgi:hypothetical protein